MNWTLIFTILALYVPFALFIGWLLIARRHGVSLRAYMKGFYFELTGQFEKQYELFEREAKHWVFFLR